LIVSLRDPVHQKRLLKFTGAAPKRVQIPIVVYVPEDQHMPRLDVQPCFGRSVPEGPIPLIQKDAAMIQDRIGPVIAVQVGPDDVGARNRPEPCFAGNVWKSD
jgi:hypothetical protein